MRYVLFITMSALLSATVTFMVITRVRNRGGTATVTPLLVLFTPTPSAGEPAPSQAGTPTPSPAPGRTEWPIHENIRATVFWVGEDASEDNEFIHNSSSAWDSDWLEHFGGVDTPYARNGYYPKDFIPDENPFYVALPYDDFGDSSRRTNANRIYWYSANTPANRSLLKNRWIRVTYKDNACYGQWEDVGPFETNDVNYVFGTDPPARPEAGIDLSPAMRTCLKMPFADFVSWQFVRDAEVPDGPWKEIVTTRQVSW